MAITEIIKDNFIPTPFQNYLVNVIQSTFTLTSGTLEYPVPYDKEGTNAVLSNGSSIYICGLYIPPTTGLTSFSIVQEDSEEAQDTLFPALDLSSTGFTFSFNPQSPDILISTQSNRQLILKGNVVFSGVVYAFKL